MFSAVGVLAVIALVAALLWNMQKDNDLKSVPTLTGKARDVAIAEIQKAGLSAQVGDPVLASDCTEGTVVKQNPLPTTSVRQNGTVTIQLCGGKPEVRVPAGLKGSKRESAIARLTEAKLKYDIKTVNDEASEDEVLKVDPPEGESVPENTKITLTVSNGKVREVPDVVGLSQEEATRVLRNDGFTVVVQNGPEVPADQAGKVTDQSPNGKEKKPTGTRVTIKVSQPEPETDPTPTVTPTGTPTGTPTTPGNGGGVGLPFPPPPGRPQD